MMLSGPILLISIMTKMTDGELNSTFENFQRDTFIKLSHYKKTEIAYLAFVKKTCIEFGYISY